MNLKQWLQLRRECRLSAMPLGMRVTMASCGDKNIIDLGLNGNSNYDENRNGHKHDNFRGNGKGNGLGFRHSVQSFEGIAAAPHDRCGRPARRDRLVRWHCVPWQITSVCIYDIILLFFKKQSKILFRKVNSAFHPL